MEWNEVSTMLWELLECLYKVLNIVGGSCLTLIGLYTFYRTFISKKIRFLGVGKSSDIWKGESCSVVIQNWSLSAISIEEVTLVVNDDYKVTVKKYLDHFLLEPLKAVKIESDRTSESPFYDQNFLDEKLELFVRCSDGKVLSAKFRKKNIKIH